MDLTATKSQHSDNKSNASADLQHFPNDQSDSNVTSQDSLLRLQYSKYSTMVACM